MTKAFASAADMTEKTVSFTEIGPASMHSPPRGTPTPA